MKKIALTTFTMLVISAGANANTVLPEVEKCGASIQAALSLDPLQGNKQLDNLLCLKGTVDATSPGTYIASQHDSFISYSIEALEKIQKYNSSLLPIAQYGDWSKLVSGSGTLDIGLAIKASGSGVLNNPDPFPDAKDTNTNATSYELTWGGNEPTGTDTKDPKPDVKDAVLTVDEIYNWLQPEKTPVIYFDLADPQNSTIANLFVSGRFYITDQSGSSLIKEWSFDNLFNNGTFDKEAKALAPKNVPVYIKNSGCNDYLSTLGVDWCHITNSRGSGTPEYIAYAPDLDLQQYTNKNYLFFGQFTVSSTSASDEEIYLTKRVSPPTDVPAPGALALLTASLFGFGIARRRKAN